MHHAQLGPEKQKLVLAKSFSKDICHLLMGRNIVCNQFTGEKAFTNKVSVNVDVLSSQMEHWILSNM